MFGKKAAQQQQQIAQQAQTQQNAYMQQAAQPTELQKELDDQNLKILRWKGGNVLDAPGMAGQASAYNNAVAQRDGERMGSGLSALAGEGNPNMMALYREHHAAKEKEAAGGAVENAWNTLQANARGYVLPSSSLSQSRAMGLASLSSQNASSGWDRYLRAQQSSGFLNSNLFNQLMGGAQALAGNPNAYKMFASGTEDLDSELTRPGDTAIVGEEGFEAVRRRPDGSLEVIPHEQSSALVAGRPNAYMRMYHAMQAPQSRLSQLVSGEHPRLY
jgi:hypothetical protein